MKLTDLSVSDWDVFIEKHNNGNFFQSSEFADLINSVPNYNAKIITYFDAELLLGILVYTEQKEGTGLIGFFSKRCIVYGGPIVIENERSFEVTLTLLKKLKISTNAIYIEIRNQFSIENRDTVFKSAGFRHIPYLNYKIQLSNYESVWNGIKGEKRRQIRKAFKNGARIEKAESIDDVKAIYNILKDRYIKKIRKPLPSVDFFISMYQIPSVELLLVKSQDNIIGGAFLARSSQRVIYDWYRIGLDKEYKTLYPSTMAVWAGLDYGIENNIQIYDFMGAGESSKKYGVREFKSQFGGDLEQYGRYIYIKKPVLYFIGKLGIKIFKGIK